MVALILIALFVREPAMAAIRDAQGKSARDLIRDLEATDDRVVMAAAEALVGMGPAVIPQLTEALHERSGCQLQWAASGVLYRLERGNPLVNDTLRVITAGKCTGQSPRDAIIRRQAAFALVGKAEGIPIIAALLEEKDVFTRRSAAFAFDDLTERLEGRPPAVEATAEILDLTAGAFARLARAMMDKDEIVRCMSYEALEQARRSRHESLRLAATNALSGQRPDCSR
jgi:HEAT repeat protein